MAIGGIRVGDTPLGGRTGAALAAGAGRGVNVWETPLWGDARERL